jgi:hypothetical protein
LAQSSSCGENRLRVKTGCGTAAECKAARPCVLNQQFERPFGEKISYFTWEQSCDSQGIRNCVNGEDEAVLIKEDGTALLCPVGDNPNLRSIATALVVSVTSTFTLGSYLRLRKLPSAEEQDKHAGIKDLLSGLMGIGDILSDVALMMLLGDHRELTLQYYGAVASLTTSALVSTLIAVLFLKRVVSDNPAAGTWLGSGKNIPITTVIMLLSMTKLESMMLLDLHVLGKPLVEFPMSTRHKLFLKQFGIVTQLLENLPQLLIAATSWSVLNATESVGLFGVKETVWLQLSLVITITSLFYGVVSKLVTSVYVSAEGTATKRSISTPSSAAIAPAAAAASGTAAASGAAAAGASLGEPPRDIEMTVNPTVEDDDDLEDDNDWA